MNTARDFTFLLLGALLASGWWATVIWDGVPAGPNNVPFVGVLTCLATAGVAAWLIYELLYAAFKGPGK